MCTIHIRIGHDDNLVIAKLTDIKIIMNAGTKCSDHSLDFCVGIYFIHSCLFYV